VRGGHASLVLSGRFAQTAAGACFVAVQRTAMTALQGRVLLRSGLDARAEDVVRLAGDMTLAGFDVRRAVFLDLETTGFAGHRGDVAWLIGLGRVVGEDMVVQQVLMHRRDEEAAMLEVLRDTLSRASALVTFNGTGFDLRFLRARLAATGLTDACLQLPHLDLLPAARRVLAAETASFKLPQVERVCLGFVRQDDVPGSEAPARFARMEQTGDCTPILPLVHHNHLDILSLLPLVGELARRARALSTPAAPTRAAAADAVRAPRPAPRPAATSEIVVERDEEAVRRPRKAPRAAAPAPGVDEAVPVDASPRALRDRARAFQANGEWQAAVRAWTLCADALPTDADPHLELSKLHEVALGDLEQALFHAQRALTLAPWSAPVQRRVNVLRTRLERG
jgi:uncharacterized protein YprB with RNaseH-like and TPR domain